MEIKIVGRPQFYLGLDLAFVELLMRLAERHYDGRCKAAAKPGPDGLLWGWRNLLTPDPFDDSMPAPKPPAVSGSFRDLDLTLKICEGAQMPGMASDQERALIWAYVRDVTHALSFANQLKWEATL